MNRFRYFYFKNLASVNSKNSGNSIMKVGPYYISMQFLFVGEE